MLSLAWAFASYAGGFASYAGILHSYQKHRCSGKVAGGIV